MVLSLRHRGSRGQEPSKTLEAVGASVDPAGARADGSGRESDVGGMALSRSRSRQRRAEPKYLIRHGVQAEFRGRPKADRVITGVRDLRERAIQRAQSFSVSSWARMSTFLSGEHRGTGVTAAIYRDASRVSPRYSSRYRGRIASFGCTVAAVGREMLTMSRWSYSTSRPRKTSGVPCVFNSR